MWKQLAAWFSAYRIPILIGSGGVVAYTAYANMQNRAAAAAAAPGVLSGPGGRPAGEEAAFIGQGAGLAVAAQTPILGLAQESIAGGLNLAGLAAQTAAGVAETAAGSAVSGTFALADVLGQVIGYMAPQAPAPAPVPTSTPEQPQCPNPPAGLNSLDLLRLYFRTVLLREPDASGLTAWAAGIDQQRAIGMSDSQIYAELCNTFRYGAEYAQRFGTPR